MLGIFYLADAYATANGLSPRFTFFIARKGDKDSDG